MATGFFSIDAAGNRLDGGDSYESRERRRKLAEALVAKGVDTSPVQHWAQGLARMMQSAAGEYQLAKIDAQESEFNAAGRKELAAVMPWMFGGGVSPSSTTSESTTGASTSTLGPIGSGKVATADAPPSPNGDRDSFVAAMMPHAQRVAQETGLDPRLVIAQSALETGYGKSAPGQNYFGIKSHGASGGQTLPTTEVVNGQPVRTSDSFRTYSGMGDSAAGYASFLKSNPRYAGLLQAQGLDAQIAALGKSGYATDPNYAGKVASIARGISLPSPAPEGVSAAAPSPAPAAPVQVASSDPNFVPSADAGREEALRKSSLAAGAPQPMTAYAPTAAPGSGTVRDSIDRAFAAVDASQTPAAAVPTPPPRPVFAGETAPADAPTVPAKSAEAESFTRLEGQPRNQALVAALMSREGQSAAGGAPIVIPAPAAAGGPPEGAMSASDRNRRLLAMALDSRLSPSMRQMAGTAMTMMQAQDKVSTVDLGGSIGVMDARGNIIRQIPKEAAPSWSKLNDGTLFDTKSGQTRAATGQPAFRPLVTPQERAQFGIPQGDTKPYQLGADGKLYAVGGNGTSVSIDQKAEGSFESAAGQKQATRFDGYIAGADKAQGALSDIANLREISNRMGSQGSSADFKRMIGPYAEAAQINIEGLSDLQAYEATIQRLAPQMHVAGSGATSDIEFKGMLNALPRISSNPAARTAILDTMEAMQRHALARGDIAAKVFNKEITRQEGESQLRALGDPMSRFREFRKANPDAFAAPGAPSAASAPAQRPQQQTPAGDPLAQAREAISRGAPRDKVIQRLRERGVSTEGL